MSNETVLIQMVEVHLHFPNEKGVVHVMVGPFADLWFMTKEFLKYDKRVGSFYFGERKLRRGDNYLSLGLNSDSVLMLK